MVVYENCIEKVGLDQKQIKSITRRFQRIANECGKIGVEIFGGSGTADLRISDSTGVGDRQLILAHIRGNFSGGDGACWEDDEGYLRGE